MAELGRSFEGELPLSAFRRLAGDLAGAPGAAGYEIRFGRDDRGRGFAEGRVRAALPLTCQRCMQPFTMPVERQWRVVLLDDPAEEALLKEGEDAFLVTDKGMLLSELVEDEMILALPLVPMHPRGSCAPPAEPDEAPAEEGGAQRPFSGLSRLKRGDS